MQKNIAKWTVAATVLSLAASSLPAAASTYDYGHHRYAHRHAQTYGSSDVTVRKSAPRPAVYGHDAFHGPAVLITAPVAIAGTFVSLPFRALDVVFPPRANDPRVLVGAPVHFAGQVAQFPFYAVNGVFGVEQAPYFNN